MRVAEAWRVALDALRANRLRSVLTMLGVVIGVAAVVALVAIGTGTKQQIEQQVEGLGSNLLIVVPGQQLGYVAAMLLAYAAGFVLTWFFGVDEQKINEFFGE